MEEHINGSLVSLAWLAGTVLQHGRWHAVYLDWLPAPSNNESARERV